jgi:hypothetical protein
LIFTYAGLTAYAFAPRWFDRLTIQGGFSAGGSTTTSRLFSIGDMPRVEQGFDVVLAPARLHFTVMETMLMIDCRTGCFLQQNAIKRQKTPEIE